MKLHTGDTVVIITGKDKGKTGRILRVLMGKNRVVIAGANMRTRHIKKTPQSPGRIVRYEASLHVSNVMVLDPKSKKRTRIGRRIVDGTKERFAKRSGEAILSGRKLKALVEKETGKEKDGAGAEKKDSPSFAKASEGKKEEKESKESKESPSFAKASEGKKEAKAEKGKEGKKKSLDSTQGEKKEKKGLLSFKSKKKKDDSAKKK